MDFYLNQVACNTRIKIKGEKNLKIKNKSFYKFGFVITCFPSYPEFSRDSNAKSRRRRPDERTRGCHARKRVVIGHAIAAKTRP